MRRCQLESFAVTAALAVLVLLCPPAAEAGKFPKVGVKCPKGTELRVDVHGTRDVCLAVAPPSCPSRLTLRVDADDHADACAAGPEAPPDEQRPTPRCVRDHELRVEEGADTCERTEKPFCRKRYKMKVGKGPDMCERGR